MTEQQKQEFIASFKAYAEAERKHADLFSRLIKDPNLQDDVYKLSLSLLEEHPHLSNDAE